MAGVQVVLGQEPNKRRAQQLTTDEDGDCFIQLEKEAGRPVRWYVCMYVCSMEPVYFYAYLGHSRPLVH